MTRRTLISACIMPYTREDCHLFCVGLSWSWYRCRNRIHVKSSSKQVSGEVTCSGPKELKASTWSHFAKSINVRYLKLQEGRSLFVVTPPDATFTWDKNGQVLGDVWAWCGVEAMLCGILAKSGQIHGQGLGWLGVVHFSQLSHDLGTVPVLQRRAADQGSTPLLFHDLGTCARARCRPGQHASEEQGERAEGASSFGGLGRWARLLGGAAETLGGS
eukprot:g13954.t1